MKINIIKKLLYRCGLGLFIALYLPACSLQEYNPASLSEDGAFVAENNGITYMVTASSFVVSAGTQVIRDEPMVDFHGPEAPRAPTATPTTPLPPPLPAEVGGG